MSSLQDKKEALFNVITPYFKEAGYIYTYNGYNKELASSIYHIGFNFLTKSDNHSQSLLHISHKEVEEIILEVGQPNKKGSGKLFYTVGNFSYWIFYESKFNQLDLSTVEGFREWGKLIIAYMEGEGKKFIEHYSYLPNVLLEMNRLEEQGKYWKEILTAGSPIWFFRGLIISKLCSDPNFNKKVNWVNTIFYDEQYEMDDWIPYYEKLKEVLEETKPQYNIDIS